jgi:proteasome accessory factor C
MTVPTTAGGSLDQVARLLTLVPLLHSREEVRLEDAAALLEVPADQVRRDLHVLFMCGLPGGYPDDLIDVDVEALDEGGDGVIRVSNADYLSRPLRLTPSEASALIVALRVLREGQSAATQAVVDRTLAKLEVAAAGGAADQVALADGEDRPAVDPGLRARLEQAAEQGHQVRLRYWVPSRDEESERVVDPHRVFTSGGAAYLHGWCHRAEAPRFFRLDRIHDAEVLATQVTTHPSEAPDLSQGFFGADPAAAAVVLRLAPEASWVPEYYEAEEVRRHADGHLDVRVRVGDERWLHRLLLRLAPHARVLEPAGAAETFSTNAQDALRLYE